MTPTPRDRDVSRLAGITTITTVDNRESIQPGHLAREGPDRSVVPDAGAPRTFYSLLTEPWIAVRGAAGEAREVGLMEVFEQAHTLVGLAGEIPTQEAAILRLLEAILHRAVDPDDDPISAWAQWWQEGLPLGQIRSYLERHAERFDLLHPQHPFFQVAGLHTASGKTSGLGKIIAELPDGSPFFTTRAPAETTRLSYAEAARWLVHVHAYDYSGIKSGAVGDERVKGGKGYPIGTGFTGTLGLLIAEGPTLRETLLLNLVLRFWREDDRVPWERPLLGSQMDIAHTQPLGPADCATWQSRRVLLLHDGQRVHDVVLSNGDPLGPQNRRGVEPATSWRYSEPQTKKFGHTVYMPLEHQAARSVWRGLGATLGERSTPVATKAGVPAFETAELLQWLTTLREEEVLDPRHPIVLRIVGMEYGPQSSSVSAVIDDRLALPLTVISDPLTRVAATSAVDAADEAVRALGRLAANLADAGGRHLMPGMDDGARDRATETAWSLLDTPYRRWVADLSSSGDLQGARRPWQTQVRRTVTRVADDLVEASGPPAIAGRVVNGRYLNSAIAENYFSSALRKALPYAFPSTTKEQA